MVALLVILVLVVGAVLLLLGLMAPRLAFPAIVASVTIGVALGMGLWLGLRLPVTASLSAWTASAIFPVDLLLEVDALAWLFGLSLITLTLAILWTGVNRPGGRRVFPRAVLLSLTALGVLAVFSGNILTRVFVWICLDLLVFLALLLLARGEALEAQAVLNLGFSSIGTLLAVAAMILISRTSDTLALHDAALTAQSTIVITLAALFRLGLFPLHLGLPTETNLRQGLDVGLRLIPATVALELLCRLMTFGIAASVQPWLTVAGIIALWSGALQLWLTPTPRLGLVYVVIAQSGLALLLGLTGGLWATATQTLMLMVGGGLMFLSAGHDDQHPWATGWAVLGAVGLAGAPLTLGFVGVGELYRGLIGAGNWFVLAGVWLGQSLLLAGCLRVVFWPVQPAEGTRWTEVIYRLGLSSLAILAVVAPAFSTALAGYIGVLVTTGLWGWAGTASLLPLGLIGLSLGLGFGLWRMAEQLAGPTLGIGSVLRHVVRLDWAYRGVWVGVRGLSTLVQTVAEVLEGEGAMLWALVVVLALWLVTQAG